MTPASESQTANAAPVSEAPASNNQTDETPSDGEAEGRPAIWQTVGHAEKLMHSGALSTGDLAELRRISPDRPYTPALWKVLYLIGQEDAPAWMRQPEWERRWATQLMGMAFCIDSARSLHDSDTPLGEALVKAGGGSSPGWSKLRFVQLLRAEGKTLEAHIRHVAQYLASKSQAANWTDVARLLFNQSNKYSEEIRLRIARRYYRTLHAQETKG